MESSEPSLWMVLLPLLVAGTLTGSGAGAALGHVHGVHRAQEQAHRLIVGGERALDEGLARERHQRHPVVDPVVGAELAQVELARVDLDGLHDAAD